MWTYGAWRTWWGDGTYGKSSGCKVRYQLVAIELKQEFLSSKDSSEDICVIYKLNFQNEVPNFLYLRIFVVNNERGIAWMPQVLNEQ